MLVASLVVFHFVMYFSTEAAESARREALETRRQAVARMEQERLRRETEERQFRETYVNELPALAPASLAKATVLGVKGEGPGAQTDLVRGRLVEMLGREGSSTIDAFKPAFYEDDLFEDLWKGDRSILQRLGVLDQGPRACLVARVTFSDAQRTDLEGLVSVHGTLSLLLITENRTKGPAVFSATGAGFDAASAAANCAKRLAETMKLDEILPR